MAQIEHIPQQVLREEQPTQITPLALQEQVPLEIPPVQQFEPTPQPKVEIHGIHKKLEEEVKPTTFPMNILTSMTSSIPHTQLLEGIFDSLLPLSSFSQLNLKPTFEDTNKDPSILVEVPNVTPPLPLHLFH